MSKLVLLFAYAATLTVNVNEGPPEDPPVDYWKCDPVQRRKILHEKLTKSLAHDPGLGNQTTSNWSVDNFLDRYLASTPADFKSPDEWTINNLIENNEHALFHPYVFEDPFKKYGVDEINEITERHSSEPSDGWKFKDFTEKYKPMIFWEQVNEEQLIVGRNDSQDKRFFSLSSSLDSTEELLSLEVARSGRRWWNDQWQLPIGPDEEKFVNKTHHDNNNVKNMLLFMKQSIYTAREKMVIMQHLRKEFIATALYKMGYLFAKTDYACKIFSSLSFKSFRSCSMMRQGIYDWYRLFHHFIDIAYNIERLEEKWFDVDILKDLLTSNDVIARKIILKDRNLTTPAMVVTAFNRMFID